MLIAFGILTEVSEVLSIVDFNPMF